jgi:hypothetical protein
MPMTLEEVKLSLLESRFLKKVTHKDGIMVVEVGKKYSAG